MITLLYTYRRSNKRRVKTSLTKYTSHFICKGSKRVTQGLRVRGGWRPNRNCNILTPLLWPSALCHSCSPDAQPEAQRPTLLGDGFLYYILSTTFLGPNSIGGPEPLRIGVVFPTTSRLYLRPSPTATVLTSMLTELYNTSTSTQSPTRSLKSHVWSSSSRNNYHAAHGSFSSGASVYECTMGIFLPRPISSANFRPRDFLS